MYVVSTFLDPNFGLNAFSPSEKEAVKRKMYNLLVATESTFSVAPESKKSSSSAKVNKSSNNNYLSFKVKHVNDKESIDKITEMIDQYLHLIDSFGDEDEETGVVKKEDPLDFWRTHEKVFPALALLAKKYLSVQASSAAVERMFSISGHIFSLKRRRLGIKFFSLLVLLKLNEELID